MQSWLFATGQASPPPLTPALLSSACSPGEYSLPTVLDQSCPHVVQLQVRGKRERGQLWACQCAWRGGTTPTCLYFTWELPLHVMHIGKPRVVPFPFDSSPLPWNVPSPYDVQRELFPFTLCMLTWCESYPLTSCALTCLIYYITVLFSLSPMTSKKSYSMHAGVMVGLSPLRLAHLSPFFLITYHCPGTSAVCETDLFFLSKPPWRAKGVVSFHVMHADVIWELLLFMSWTLTWLELSSSLWSFVPVNSKMSYDQKGIRILIAFHRCNAEL